jgi:hypothetical protein
MGVADLLLVLDDTVLGLVALDFPFSAPLTDTSGAMGVADLLLYLVDTVLGLVASDLPRSAPLTESLLPTRGDFARVFSAYVGQD